MRPHLAPISALALGLGLVCAPVVQAQLVKKAIPVEDDKPAVPAPLVPDLPPALPVIPPPPVPVPVPETKKEEPEPRRRSRDDDAPPTERVAPLTYKAVPVDESGTTPADKPKPKPNLSASVLTNQDARTMMLEVAGPRGQIVDRNGVCFAQNKIVYYLALNFPVLSPDERQDVIAFGRARINQANKLLGTTWDVPDDKLVAHYKDRRWLPLIFSKSGDITISLTDQEQEKIKPLLGKGLMLQPTYQRYYPKGDSACHIIGYTGVRQPLPTGPIVEGEPSILEPMGRSGIEAAFEERLRGKPGMTDLIFNPDGSTMSEGMRRRAEPGSNVVLTLDAKIQKYAENALKRGAPNGGAMVILDVRNGDILAMASNPGYDLNDFIPLHTSYLEKLTKDPKTPMLGRAFQGTYFPASTFKVVTALAGLDSGAITPATTFDCASSFAIGDRVFHNWNKNGEGMLTVVGAIKRSCNTWFYQAGLATGSAKLMAMADRMGFGQPVGLPIPEAKFSLPSDAFYMQHYGYKILPGMLASMSIGQIVEVSPLQAAQCMATLADGKAMPKIRLVKQVQDYNDRVIDAWDPGVRKQVNLLPMARDTVVKGMVAVVNAEGGTGHNAALDDIQVAGKTGTAQWKIYPDESRNRNLAWFTGFLPANNPVYAFALVYEGSPGEKVSGGSIAAPIVHEVFSNIEHNADDTLVLAQKAAPRAEVDNGGSVGSGPDTDSDARRAEPVRQQAPPPQAERPSVGGFFKRLFGGH